MKFVISLLFVAASFSLVRGQSCNPPGGGAGKCIPVMKCPSMAALLSKPSRTQAEIDLLRAAACGFEGSTPKVCCPNPCNTPEGLDGHCVDIYKCAHLADMIKPPVPTEVAQYLQKSKCNGPTQYSVCCGPAKQQPTKVEVGNCEDRVFVSPPDPRTQCCGTEAEANDKIVGGEAAGLDEYPWLVIIEYAKDNRIKLLCGGTLISSRYVLTAAHCITGAVLNSGTPKNVRVGEYDTSNSGPDCVPAAGGGQDCSDPVRIVPIERVIAHPEYDALARRNDIGLIRLADNVPYTDFIRPICLPESDVTASPPGPYLNLTAAGWGAINETVSKSTIKLFVNLPFVSRQQCQTAYSSPKRRANLWDKQLCAGGLKDKDSCKGDSGGPLMYRRQTVNMVDLVGVVSFGPKPCGVDNVPGVYTKVFAYKSWINSVIQP